MKFKLSKQYLRGPEIYFAKFSELADANLFMNEKLKADAAVGLRGTYRLYEDDQLFRQWPKGNGNLYQQTQLGQQESTSNFRPTPFPTAPRPPGSPNSYIDDNSKNSED